MQPDLSVPESVARKLYILCQILPQPLSNFGHASKEVAAGFGPLVAILPSEFLSYLKLDAPG